MVESTTEYDLADGAESPAQERFLRRWLVWTMRFAAVLLVVSLVAFAVLWFSRERIADNIIADELAKRGLPATYVIEEIGPQRQILRDIVVGDPAQPDLVVDRAEVAITPRLGIPAIGRITLQGARLYGRWDEAQQRIGFGSLDKVIYTGSKEPFRLPDLDLALVDGRARIESPFGIVGVRAGGAGPLRSGFKGEIAVAAPALAVAGCKADGTSLYGKLSIIGEKPRFAGPLRFDRLGCAAQSLAVGKSEAVLDLVLDATMDGGEGSIALDGGQVRYATQTANKLGGNIRLVYRDRQLTSQLALDAAQADLPGASFASLSTEGTLRTRDGISSVDYDGNIAGKGAAAGDMIDRQFAALEQQTSGTLLQPLLRRLRGGLAAEQPGSALRADLSFRRNGDVWSLVVPRGDWQGRSGASILAMTSVQASGGKRQPLRIAGNFRTAGRDLPQVSGRAERLATGDDVIRLSMAEYAAGDARLSLPALLVSRAPNGVLGFSGEMRASGAFPGGRMEGLMLPIAGNWNGARGIRLLERCTDVRFDRLQYANLRLREQALQLCPPPGSAIVRSDGNGLKIAAGTSRLALSGQIGGAPIAIASGPLGLAWPGTVAARDLRVTFGTGDAATRINIAALTGRMGTQSAGQFAGTAVMIPAVPLNLENASGNWRFADGKLALDGASLLVSDRNADPRFAPLIARDATLQFADGRITADALLRNPESDRAVAQAIIRHDLGSATGGADLLVQGLQFDRKLTPVMLTPLAGGVVSLVDGRVDGAGRIDWDRAGVRSSGRFFTESMNLSAAFGPVKGLSGVIEFDDLLAMRTKPNQILRIAEINTGVAVENGIVRYQLLEGQIAKVDGGEWPFVGGRLILEPARINMGSVDARHMTLRIEGLDAAKFLQRMELANLTATGIFDGRLPLVFDENGGRIEGGVLIARPPGGTLAYVGELSYAELGTMGNLAFDALKSLRFNNLSILMDGAIAGELVTKVQFNGISQGTGARQNFITRKIASLPIEFVVNIKAPFYQLISSTRSLYDPAYVRDPRDLGLIPGGPAIPGAAVPEPPVANLPPVQPAESDPLP